MHVFSKQNPNQWYIPLKERGPMGYLGMSYSFQQ